MFPFKIEHNSKPCSFFSSMSCISLRLAPARKAWKSLTSTLGKLRKIHRSKAIKKPRKHVNSTAAPPTKSSKFLARRFRRKKPPFRSVIYGLHKRPAPVYIDKLFKEPANDLVEYLQPQALAKVPSSSRIEKTVKVHDQTEEVTATSKGDDVWESLALASPLMQGINERAEEFIARFRQEMKAQEMSAGKR